MPDNVELEWYRNALDKLIGEYEERAQGQKELMDEGNAFAAGRWTELCETVRYVKWIRRY